MERGNQALRKEPDRRYTSVGTLVADLRRYQRAEPVEARSATLGYRTQKFLRRNRAGTAVATAFLAGIAVSAVLPVRQRNQAQQEAERAQRETQKAEAVSGYLTDLLQRAIQIYQETLRPRHPWIALSFMTRGRIQAERGRYAEAVALHRRALSISREQHPVDHPIVASRRMYLGRALMEQDRYQEAESHLTQSLRGFRQEEEKEKVRELRSDLAELYAERGKPRKAASYRPPKQSGNQDPERQARHSEVNQ